MFPTKQAKSGKEPKLHQAIEWRKNLRWTQAQSGASSPLANERTLITKQIGSKH